MQPRRDALIFAQKQFSDRVQVLKRKQSEIKELEQNLEGLKAH